MKNRITPIAGLALLVFVSACAETRDREAVQQDQASVTANEFRAAMTDMRAELRSTLDDFGSQISDLDERYSTTNQEMSREWEVTREELRSYRQTLEADLARLENANVDEADQLKNRIASDLEEFTHRVERAELKSVDSPEFVSAAQDRMSRLEQDIRALEQEAQALPTEARRELSENMQDYSTTAAEIRTQLNGLVQASAQEIADEREDIAEAVSSLTASVKRELFEARQHTVTTTSMNN